VDDLAISMEDMSYSSRNNNAIRHSHILSSMFGP
jgi:hypothetical protein